VLLLALAALGPAALPATAYPTEAATHFYPAEADAARDLDRALASARAQGRAIAIVFGADWCHDSQALAGVLTGDAFKSEFAARVAVVFIDVGKPQTGNGRNLDLAARFGLDRLKNTPAMVVLDREGKRKNSKRDAIGWRNADTRGEAAILAWFRKELSR
jgi:thiol-disulfide isomerase/thioredoxin